MEKHGIKGNLTALENMYFKRWQSIVKYSFVAKKPAGRMILWQEVFDNNNPVRARAACRRHDPLTGQVSEPASDKPPFGVGIENRIQFQILGSESDQQSQVRNPNRITKCVANLFAIWPRWAIRSQLAAQNA